MFIWYDRGKNGIVGKRTLTFLDWSLCIIIFVESIQVKCFRSQKISFFGINHWTRVSSVVTKEFDVINNNQVDSAYSIVLYVIANNKLSLR